MKNRHLQGSMETGLRIGLGVVLGAIAPALPGYGQSAAAGIDSGPRVLVRPAELAPTQFLLPDRIIRVIVDPNLEDRWLLCRDPNQTGGPGRLVRISAGRTVKKQTQAGGASSRVPAEETSELRPVIHAGDRLIVEENSAVTEARLEAVALESATVGSVFSARLKIGGKLVRATALGAGRAAFAMEVRR